MNKSILPLRTGVGIVVLNSENKVFVGKRKDNPGIYWQMPQGGVNLNENLTNAMKRELLEETSISNIRIIKELNYWMEYELPTNLIGIIWKGKFRGQKQKWFIVKFEGKESEINIKTKSPEFIEWRWIDIEELPNVIVKFKKHIYDKLLKELILIV
jgi:putative (di)nucleoside polyphosphate hydrolase